MYVSCSCGKVTWLERALESPGPACERCGKSLTTSGRPQDEGDDESPFQHDRYVLRMLVGADGLKAFSVDDGGGKRLLVARQPGMETPTAPASLASGCGLELAGWIVFGLGMLFVSRVFPSSPWLAPLGFLAVLLIGSLVAIWWSVAGSWRLSVVLQPRGWRPPALQLSSAARAWSFGRRHRMHDVNGAELVEVLSRWRPSGPGAVATVRGLAAPSDVTIRCDAGGGPRLWRLVRARVTEPYALVRGQETVGLCSRSPGSNVVDVVELDLTMDPGRTLDRRVAVGLGLLLLARRIG